MCEAAGQARPTPILLRYRAGDWNALHRDLYGDLVFPLQVVVGLDEPGTDFAGGEFLLVEQRIGCSDLRSDRAHGGVPHEPGGEGQPGGLIVAGRGSR
jgi:hypothetical protein